MKEFSESNFRNAGIDMDIKNNKVNFSYPEKKTRLMEYSELFLVIFFIWFIFTMFFIFFPFLLPYLLLYNANHILFIYFIFLMIAPPSLTFLFIVYSKKFREKFSKIYPNINYYFNYMVSRQKVRKYKTNSKEIIIPKFEDRKSVV